MSGSLRVVHVCLLKQKRVRIIDLRVVHVCFKLKQQRVRIIALCVVHVCFRLKQKRVRIIALRIVHDSGRNRKGSGSLPSVLSTCVSCRLKQKRVRIIDPLRVVHVCFQAETEKGQDHCPPCCPRVFQAETEKGQDHCPPYCPRFRLKQKRVRIIALRIVHDSG